MFAGFVAIAAAIIAAYVIVDRPGWYVRWQVPLRYEHIITIHAGNHDLAPALVAAVIEQESGFDPGARSGAGAVGLMQLTAETADGIATRTGGAAFKQSDLLDPEINVRYGTWYLAHLRRTYERRGFAEDDAELLMLAAYNAGQGHVEEWLEDHRGTDDRLDAHEIPFPETRAYVEQVVSLAADIERAYPDLGA